MPAKLRKSPHADLPYCGFSRSPAPKTPRLDQEGCRRSRWGGRSQRGAFEVGNCRNAVAASLRNPQFNGRVGDGTQLALPKACGFI